MALAELTDYEDRHGDVDGTDAELVQTLLEDASALVLDVADGSEEGWALEEEDAVIPGNVVAVCVAAAYRAFTNPNAVSRQALGMASFTFKGDIPDAMYLTDREVRLIRKAGRRSTFQAVTLESPYSGDTLDDNELLLG